MNLDGIGRVFCSPTKEECKAANGVYQRSDVCRRGGTFRNDRDKRRQEKKEKKRIRKLPNHPLSTSTVGPQKSGH